MPEILDKINSVEVNSVNMNVTIEDIKDIENKIGKELSKEQREVILREYNRIVLDRGDSWEVILTNLIIDIR